MSSMNRANSASAGRFPCPCCGYSTRHQAERGSYDICPVCCWEDSPADDWASNVVTLREAQRNFDRIGACDEGWRAEARPPTADEARSPEWKSLDDEQAAEQASVIAMIEAAFGDLSRGGGMRIYEAELADDYGEESERNRLRKHDTYQSWREIADEVIATFDSVLSFFDPEGFRFHLPAYMTWTVRFSETWDSNTADSTLFAVTRVPPAAELDSWQSERFGRFDAPQRRAIAAFLRYMAAHHDDQDARAAIGFWEGLS